MRIKDESNTNLEQIKHEYENVLRDLESVQNELKSRDIKGDLLFYATIGSALATVAGVVGSLITGISGAIASSQETAQATQMAMEFIESSGLRQKVAELNERFNTSAHGVAVEINTAFMNFSTKLQSLISNTALLKSFGLTIAGVTSLNVLPDLGIKNLKKVEILNIDKEHLLKRKGELQQNLRSTN